MSDISEILSAELEKFKDEPLIVLPRADVARARDEIVDLLAAMTTP